MSIYSRMQKVSEELRDLACNDLNGGRRLNALQMAQVCNDLWLEMERLQNDVFELRTKGVLPDRPVMTIDPPCGYVVDQTSGRLAA